MTIDDECVRTGADTVDVQTPQLHLFEYLLKGDDKVPLDTACNYIQSVEELSGQMIGVLTQNHTPPAAFKNITSPGSSGSHTGAQKQRIVFPDEFSPVTNSDLI